MKKIILLVLGMIFLTNCGNDVAVKPENRESFTENPYFKSEEFLAFKDKERKLQFVKKNEYNTFLEALEHSYEWGEGVFEEYVLNSKRNMEYVKKIEAVAKSKFVVSKDDSDRYIYFTAVYPNEFNGEGKNNIIEVGFSSLAIRKIRNVSVPFKNGL